MKRFLFSIVFLLGSISICLAQTQQEVVYLKNGSIIRGTIIEQVPGESLKIQTGDGSIFVFFLSEVSKITKEGTMKAYSSTRKYSVPGNGVKTGYRGFIDLSYTVGTGDYSSGRVEFSTSQGYQFNPYFYAGLGAAVHYYHEDDVVEVPIFADFRADILDQKISPFIDLKLGYTVHENTGFYMSPTVGCRFGLGENVALNVGIGYTMQKMEVNYFTYSYSYAGSERKNIGGFSFRVGLEF